MDFSTVSICSSIVYCVFVFFGCYSPFVYSCARVTFSEFNFASNSFCQSDARQRFRGKLYIYSEKRNVETTEFSIFLKAKERKKGATNEEKTTENLSN